MLQRNNLSHPVFLAFAWPQRLMFGKGLQLRLRLLRTHAGLQPPHDRSSERIVLVDANSQRHPHFGAGKLESRWHNADHRAAEAIDADCFSQDFRVCCEPVFPEFVAEYDNTVVTRFSLSRKKASADFWICPQRRKKLRRYVRHRNLGWIARTRDR